MPPDTFYRLKIAFVAGALPWTALRKLTALPRPLAEFKGEGSGRGEVTREERGGKKGKGGKRKRGEGEDRNGKEREKREGDFHLAIIAGAHANISHIQR